MTEYITIKGARGGLRLHILDSCEWTDAFMALQKQLTDGAALLQGMKLSLDLGHRELSPQALDELHSVMRSYQPEPVDILSESRTVRAEARTMGFIAKPPMPKSATVEVEQTSTVMSRTVRSGQIVRHHGDVMLLGDVNAGAEIIASGSVIVFGRVRGVIHAGAMGDRSAVICAIELSATQLRIADLRARAPEDQGQKVPEIACIEDTHIAVHAWHEYRR